MKRLVTTPVRLSRSIRYVLLMLGVLVMADAHIVTALAGGHVVVESTCGAGLPTLTRDASPSVLQSLEPTPSTLSQSPSTVTLSERADGTLVLRGHSEGFGETQGREIMSELYKLPEGQAYKYFPPEKGQRAAAAQE